MTEPSVREQTIAEYETEFPLFREYRAVIREHSDPAHSVHDPTPGIDVRVATARALRRIDSPPRHELDVDAAVAYLLRLQDEIDAEAPRQRDLNDLVTDSMFQCAGCVPSAADWVATLPEERDEDVAGIAADATDDELRRMLAEALYLAMPGLLAQISEDDAQRRRRHLGAVPPTGEG